MKTIKKIILFAFVASLLVTCTKDKLPPGSVVGQPVFSFNGTIGGSNISLQAGINNYYMYSSYTQNTAGVNLGVYNFIGNLQSTATAKNSIQITINDYTVTATNVSLTPSHIDSSLSTTATYYYDKPGGDTTGYAVTFIPKIYDGSAEAFTYYFGDHTPNTITTNSLPVTHTYTAATAYTTSVTVLFSGCGQVSTTNPINIFKGSSQLMIDSVTYSVGTKLGIDTIPVTYTATISNGTSPYTFKWNYGDGSAVSSITSTSHTIVVTHNYLDSNSMLFSGNLKVKDNLRDSETYNYNAWDGDSSYTGCLMNYKMSVPAPVVNTDALSDITIVYTDVNGNVFTSNSTLQPGTSTFSISSVSAYKNNLNNQATKELTVKFNCMLYNTLTGSPVSASGTAIVAVAYP